MAVRRRFVLGIAGALLVLLTASGAVAAPLTVAWDKSTDAGVRGYMVFVGTRPNDPLSAFDVGNTTSFQFTTGSSSGTLYFSVASYGDNHVPGVRSPEVTATLGSGSAPVSGSARVAALDTRTSDAVAQRACFDDRQCYAVTPLLHSGTRVTSLAVDPFGQLYFIEGDSRVRVLSPTGATEMALEAANINARVLSLAVDPQFAVTRRVFVAEASARQTGTFDIVRYRSVANQLGEHASIVPGLPAGSLPPILTMDAAAHIYAVLPAASPSRLAYGGLVLRFNDDGSVPRDNPLGSPLFGRAPDAPAAAAIDAQNYTLLLTGANRNAPASVVQLALNSQLPTPRSEVASEVVLLGGEGQLLRARRQADGSYELATMTMAGAVSAATSPDGRLYVAIAGAGGGADIVRLDSVAQ